MYGVRLKGWKDYMHTTRKIILLQIVVDAYCPNVAHQPSELPYTIDYNVPCFAPEGVILLTH
jgi:hypothetical protein